ncbi:Maf family protein [Microbulbifer hydrolyticus]|uniref:7-methyl-GTP pyrophosphatase n=1 Tax=Microbulbifer hydrolyticus TaxID=48074 RepID=A0A6P1TBS5_9GAMM|nr:nucleoside triphosphate pyrophosphatase [Microbulbifer hydrolyticus]MBB5210319.1 MAF protein [Microbulbifer hydrolyticus]QHQ39185.1 septum formation inhibitor Maf [Microbulbifer hydrolyticus]
MRRLILASSSPYRRALLEKLRLPFESASPHINEEALPGESALELATRLATEKAHALHSQFPDAIIIGSDQVAECEGRQLGKPGTRAKALEQLLLCAGHPVTFHTGLCVLDGQSARHTTICEPFRVYFRDLTRLEAENYIELDNPLDCAGSFKAEGLGIALFEKMEGNDVNTLIGLPLIRLIELLKPYGIDPLTRN